jgi:ribosomal RNA-processing protein 36
MEAASTSSNSSDGEDEDSTTAPARLAVAEARTRTNRNRPTGSSRTASNSSSSESDSDSEAPRRLPDLASSSEDEQLGEEDSSVEERNSNDKFAQAESDCEEESEEGDIVEDVPLAQRIEKQREQTIDLTQRRKRKSEALKIATRRLADLKKAKRVKDEHGKEAPQSEVKRSKHAPTEASSKRSDFYNRHGPQLNESGIGVEIGAHRYKPRDPRISSLSGRLNVEHFEHNYEFLQEIREKEIALLKQKITARKTSGRKGHTMRQRLGITQEQGGGSGDLLEEDQAELKRLQHEKAAMERQQIDRAAKRSVKKKLQQQVEEGQRRGPFFMKRRELKKLHVEAKFDELRKRGGDQAVQKAVAKRRKKNKSRDAGLLGGRDGNKF